MIRYDTTERYKCKYKYMQETYLGNDGKCNDPQSSSDDDVTQVMAPHHAARERDNQRPTNNGDEGGLVIVVGILGGDDASYKQRHERNPAWMSHSD